MIKEKVVVIGGGVGGLTSAHELIERDFDVEVYERRGYLGGKAASRRDPSNLPTEHGFRFFPSWYRHLTDTLGRIPCRGTRGTRDPSTVADRLIPIHHGLLAFYAREPMPWVTHVPRTANQMRTQASFLSSLSNAGLAPAEVALITRKLAQFFATPDSIRLAQWERITWWDYMECDGKSAAYQNVIAASTRLMIAAQPKVASAYTIGRLAQRTFSDAWTTVDRILDGPTSEVWIDPWVDHMRGCGAQFHLGWELERIVFCPGKSTQTDVKTDCGDDCAPGPSGGSLNVISHVLMSRVVVGYVKTLRSLVASLRASLDDGTPSPKTRRTLRSCHELATAVLEDREWTREVNAATERRKKVEPPTVDDDDRLLSADLVLHTIWMATSERDDTPKNLAELLKRLLNAPTKQIQSLEPNDLPRIRAWDGTKDVVWSEYLASVYEASVRLAPPEDGNPHGGVFEATAGMLDQVSATNFARSKVVNAQYFVFALPVEQMAYYANRTAAMTFHDPSLNNLLRLTPYVSWMAGIQFYLKEPCHLVEGHLLCMDSEWSLTAIEQTQFWGDTNFELRGALQKKLQRAGQQVKAVLSVDISTWDRPGRFVPREALNCTRDEIASEVWGELKASVTRLTKSARLRDDMLLDGPPLRHGVNFNLDDNISDIYDAKKQAEYEKARGLDVEMAAATQFELPYIYGATREFNSEPMLLSGPGSHALRPEERTAIENMFLAADYIRTDTDLACMEGANEAGRRAANALLQTSGSLHPPCQVWTLSMTRDALTAMGRVFGDGKGGAWELAAQSARTAGHLVDSLLGVTGLTRLRYPRNGNER
jgi:hypothetical protein